MRQFHSDLAPVLAIVAGGTLGAIASGLAVSSLTSSAPPERLFVDVSALEAPPRAPLIYIDGLRIQSDVGAPSFDEWRRAHSTFTALAVSAALSEWFTLTGTSPSLIEGVESLDVLSGDEAVQEYGEQARSGVIVVTLRRTEQDVPATNQPSYTSSPTVLNIGEVRRAMFAAFPESVRAGAAGGTATVDFFIGERAEVNDIRIGQTSGHQDVDQAALAVATLFRFSPALDGDQPVATWFKRDLTFDMQLVEGRPVTRISAGLPQDVP